MKFSKLVLAILPASFIVSVPAQAFPDNAAELREIIATEFAGNANAYVEEERGDFRRMACRNRADLVQQLLDDGLVVSDIPFDTAEDFYECAFDEDSWTALALIIDPEVLAVIEQEASTYSLPLQHAVYGDNYEGTRLLMENGAHTVDTRGWTQGTLTKDGHRLLVAHYITRENEQQAARGMEDAGYGDILADARQPGFWELVYQIGTGSEASGGGGGGLLGGIADIAIGAALGGSQMDFLMAGAGGSFLDAIAGGGEGGGSGQASLSPEGLEMQRRLSRYLLTVDAPPEPAPQPEAEPAALAAQPAAGPAPASATLSTLEELERLADLRDRGVLSDAEFEAMKGQIIAPAIAPAAVPTSSVPSQMQASPPQARANPGAPQTTAPPRPSGRNAAQPTRPVVSPPSASMTQPDLSALTGAGIEFDDIEATDLAGMLANARAVAATGDVSIFYDEKGQFRTTQAPEVAALAAQGEARPAYEGFDRVPEVQIELPCMDIPTPEEMARLEQGLPVEGFDAGWELCGDPNLAGAGGVSGNPLDEPGSDTNGSPTSGTQVTGGAADIAFQDINCEASENVSDPACAAQATGGAVSVLDYARGENCNSGTSFNIEIRNDLTVAQDVRICLQRSDGSQSCTIRTSVRAGEAATNYVCAFGGEVLVYSRITGERNWSAPKLALRY